MTTLVTKLKAVKSVDDLVLEGVDCKGEMLDGSWRRLEFTDDAGNSVVVTADYGMHVSVLAPLKMRKVWIATGTIHDVAFTPQRFETKDAADRWVSELGRKSDGGADAVVVEGEEADERLP